MSSDLVRLAKRIRGEFDELEIVLLRVKESWESYQRSSDDYYLDSAALNLHGLYNGLERVFELIATTIDESKPNAENWHQALLLQMTEDKPPLRPAVLSRTIYIKLDEYRGFHHVVRNLYTYKFDPKRIQKLVDEVPDLYAQVRIELFAFADFLEHH